MAAEEPSTQSKIGDVASAAGLRRVHIVAWRDLEDVEAGGSEVHADEVASRWAAAGVDVLLRTSRAHGRPTQGRRHGYRVVRRAGRHAVFLDAPLQEALRRDGRRDGLLEVWNGLPFFSPLWARGPRVTFIHHVHADMWGQVMTPGLARLGRFLELRAAPPLYRRTPILTPSPSSRDEIVERLGLPAAHVSAVPNGVDGRFCPGGERSARPRVVSVGRLVAHKHVDRLIDACEAARRSVPELELLVAGDGYERHALERHIADRGAESWVTLLGRVSDDQLLDLYRSAWVVASASSDEGWGMTITEAAACGTPAVATRIVGHSDCVLDGRSGILADGVDDLGQALTQVLTDADLRRRLGAGALDRAQLLSWDETALQIMRSLAAAAAP